MDFKVAGSRDGITAFQMDIKVEGITLEILTQALAAAKVGRTHILERMAAASPAPRGDLSPLAPRVGRMRIDPAKSGMVIGAGGKNIRSICESTGATDIQIDESGAVTIAAPSQAALDAALAIVRGTCVELEVGTIYRGVSVVSLTDFGAFIELAPGKTGLLHVSELALTRVDVVSSVIKPGDLVDVKLLEINARGQLRLSRRAVLEADGGGASPAPAAAPAAAVVPTPPRREPRVTVTRAPRN
jgi:polyribonucleotide nucleotidyltransferase